MEKNQYAVNSRGLESAWNAIVKLDVNFKRSQINMSVLNDIRFGAVIMEARLYKSQIIKCKKNRQVLIQELLWKDFNTTAAFEASQVTVKLWRLRWNYYDLRTSVIIWLCCILNAHLVDGQFKLFHVLPTK